MRIIASRILSRPSKKMSAMAALISRHSVSGIELRGAGRDVHDLDGPVHAGNVLSHVLAGEGAGVVGYDSHLPVAPAGILCQGHVDLPFRFSWNCRSSVPSPSAPIR